MFLQLQPALCPLWINAAKTTYVFPAFWVTCRALFVGVRGWPWGRRAKDLMTSCGAQQIGALTWRGSYALIGVKDGTAWAEAIAIAGDGMAVAVAVVPWQELPPEMLPWCDTKAPMLATKGEMHSSGNLEIHAPSGKCRYQVFEEESAKTCFSISQPMEVLICCCAKVKLI